MQTLPDPEKGFCKNEKGKARMMYMKIDDKNLDYDDRERMKTLYPGVVADLSLCEDQLKQLCKMHANPFLLDDDKDWSVQFQAAFDELKEYRGHAKHLPMDDGLVQALNKGRYIAWPEIEYGALIHWDWDGEIMPCEFVGWKPGSKNGKPTVYAEVVMRKETHHMMSSPARVFYKSDCNILNVMDFGRTWYLKKLTRKI